MGMLTSVVISHHWTVCNYKCDIRCGSGEQGLRFLIVTVWQKVLYVGLDFFFCLFFSLLLIGPAGKCFIT